MTKDYYQTPSPIGKPILDLFLEESDYKEDCIHAIWHLEESRNANFNTLNAVKYLWRLGQKDPDYRDDLNKAIEYLSWELDTIDMLSSDLKQEIESTGLTIDELPPASYKEVKKALEGCDTANALIGKIIAACQELLAEYDAYYLSLQHLDSVVKSSNAESEIARINTDD